MRYMVLIEKGEKGYVVHVPDLPGCIAAGKTREEVLNLIKEAIEFHIEDLRKDDKPIPQPSSASELVEVSAA